MALGACPSEHVCTPGCLQNYEMVVAVPHQAEQSANPSPYRQPHKHETADQKHHKLVLVEVPLFIENVGEGGQQEQADALDGKMPHPYYKVENKNQF